MNEPNQATNSNPDQAAQLKAKPEVTSPPQVSSIEASGSAREAGRGEIRTPAPNIAGDQPQHDQPSKPAKPDADPKAPPAQKA